MNWSNLRRLVAASWLSILFGLAGCDGSDKKELVGTVATGAPIVGASVAVKGANGQTAGPVTTDAQGVYRVNVKGLTTPFLIAVTGGQINGTPNTREFHSIAKTDGRANVTTLTELQMAALVNGNPGVFFDSPNFTGLTSQAIDDAEADVIAFFSGRLDLSALNDFITTTFQPQPGDAMDDTLEALKDLSDHDENDFVDDVASFDDDDNGGGGGGGGGTTLTCNTANFSVPAAVPTPAELTQFAKTYVADEGTDNGLPPPNNAFIKTGTATAILTAAGAVTYNGNAKTLTSICFVPADNQIVVHFAGGHIDFRANGTMSGVAAETPTFLLIQTTGLAVYTGTYNLTCVITTVNCTQGVVYALTVSPNGQASINNQSTSGDATVSGSSGNETFRFGTAPNEFLITVQNGVIEGARIGSELYTPSGNCGTFCS